MPWIDGDRCKGCGACIDFNLRG
ncbi:MAG: 4Fe-4S binding protein [Candidatus Omnitrophica bacterium]|nr:4Fe-4S binding protein [Candidatus Omnitrophota bacterium]